MMTLPAAQHNGTAPRRFEFPRDSFAFANELLWEYHFDLATGRATFAKRDPKPDYGLRCFVLTKAARQFLYHAHFDAKLAPCDNLEILRQRIREVLSRNPRVPCAPGREVTFPGYESLRER